MIESVRDLAEYFSSVLSLVGVFGVVGAMLLKLLFDSRLRKEASDEVRVAEREAFIEYPAELENKLRELSESQAGLEERAVEVAQLIEESRSAISTGRLFNLYNKQIEKYQCETRLRATWSFLFALFSMCAGFGFLIWGGTVLLTAKETIVVVAGGIISTIGGAVGGFITKTFLDVHRLSLLQLNRYFRQPVINDHILMAQRLADECDDTATRTKAYETVINSISGLIANTTDNEEK